MAEWLKDLIPYERHEVFTMHIAGSSSHPFQHQASSNIFTAEIHAAGDGYFTRDHLHFL